MELNRKNVKTLYLLVTFGVLLNVVAHNLNNVQTWTTAVLGVLSPIIMGLVLAFVINIPMSLMEKYIFKKRRGKVAAFFYKIRRPLSIFLSILTIAAILVGVVAIIVPQFTAALTSGISKVQPLVENLRVYLTEYEDEAPQLVQWINSLNIDWEGIKNWANNLLKNGIVPVVSFVTTAATSVFGTALNVILAVILAINILSIKEKLAHQVKQVMHAFLKERTANRIIEISRMSGEVFSAFVSCQILEAMILAVMCYLGMLLFRFPYAFLVSVVVGVTALVPIIGAWVATGIGAILILTVAPMKALWFVVFFVIIQQIEGNMIYPRVVGRQVGLPAMWVLIAITIGGGILGVAGMLLGVPTVAVLYTLLRKEVHERLDEKNIDKTSRQLPEAVQSVQIQSAVLSGEAQIRMESASVEAASEAEPSEIQGQRKDEGKNEGQNKKRSNTGGIRHAKRGHR